MSNLSIQDIKKETMKLLGTTNEADVNYITEDLINAPATEITIEEFNKRDRPSLQGHSMRYGTRDGFPSYEFLSNAQLWGNVCEDNKAFWISQVYYDHTSAGYNCSSNNNNTAVITFYPK